MKEVKEMVTIREQIQSPHSELCHLSLKELILPLKFASLQLRECNHQEVWLNKQNDKFLR